MSQNSINYTKLNDRALFYDGDTVASKDSLYKMLLSGVDITDSSICPMALDEEIEQYNEIFDDALQPKTEIKEYDKSWNIPEKYKKLDLKKQIFEKLLTELASNKSFTENDINLRVTRTHLEYKLWEKKELSDLLRTLLYIVDTFHEKNIVWGTGRGSSCCCYILYLIGLHDVDSVLYDLDLKEFFR